MKKETGCCYKGAGYSFALETKTVSYVDVRVFLVRAAVPCSSSGAGVQWAQHIFKCRMFVERGYDQN